MERLGTAIDADRKFPRKPANLTFLLPDGWKAEVVDVSLSGLKIRSVAYLARNQQLDGHLVLADGRRIALHVLVVWSTPADPAGFVLAEAGLEILNVPAEYAAALVDIFAQEG